MTIEKTDRFILSNRWEEKKEKPGGETVITTRELIINNSQHKLPVGTELRECNDGWFAVYVEGVKVHHIRMSPEVKKLM